MLRTEFTFSHNYCLKLIFFYTFKQFGFKGSLQVDLRVGTIIDVNDFPKARKPAYQLTIDFGDLGVKKTSAQITTLYSKEALLNRQIVAIVNFPKKQIANFMSACLVLGAVNGKDVILLNPEDRVKNGTPVS
nr:tRNA-binding protein [Snuella sedimenti]